MLFKFLKEDRFYLGYQGFDLYTFKVENTNDDSLSIINTFVQSKSFHEECLPQDLKWNKKKRETQLSLEKAFNENLLDVKHFKSLKKLIL